MKKKARRRTVVTSRKYAAPRAAVTLSMGTAVVKLNTHAIRLKALKDYRLAEEKLARLKVQLQRYNEHDIPGFRVWMNQACGRLLTRQRELANAISEKQSLLLEVEEWAHGFGLSFTDAYRKVMWRRAHPKEAEEEDRQMEENAAKQESGGASAGAKDEEWADPFSEDDWADLDEFFGTPSDSRRPSKRGGGGESPGKKSARDLYRKIVRRLHPDHHGHMNEAQKNLWNEAQKAYRDHDVNALHGILSRCGEGEGEGGIGNQTPVSVIRQLILHFQKTTRSVGQEVRRVKSDLAWGFEQSVRDPRFVRRIKQDLEDTIREAEWHLRGLQGTLSNLERAAAGPVRPRKSNRARPASFLDGEPEFQF